MNVRHSAEERSDASGRSPPRSMRPRPLGHQPGTGRRAGGYYGPVLRQLHGAVPARRSPRPQRAAAVPRAARDLAMFGPQGFGGRVRVTGSERERPVADTRFKAGVLLLPTWRLMLGEHGLDAVHMPVRIYTLPGMNSSPRLKRPPCRADAAGPAGLRRGRERRALRLPRAASARAARDRGRAAVQPARL